MGLADPLPVQYVRWLGDLLQGDPGTSLRSGQPVGQLMLASLPITVELAVLATLIARSSPSPSAWSRRSSGTPASILPPASAG